MGLKSFRIFVIFMITAIVVGLAQYESFAASAGGFRIFASDAEAMGKGSAFTGEADNASAVVYNPAGMTQLGGTHVSIGFGVIQPSVEHFGSAGGRTKMRRDTFQIPHIYVVSDLGFYDAAFGMGTTTHYGLTTDWAPDSFSRYVATRTELENIDTFLTGAYQVTEKLSVGGGWNYMFSKLDKRKQVFQASGDAFAQIKGDDNGVGYSASSLYKINGKHQVGVLYRSEMDLEYEGNLTAEGLTGGLAALFSPGGSSYKTGFRTELTLPQSVVAGYSFRPNNRWILNMDVDWTDWSSVESERVTFPEESGATRLAILDALTASNRDWDSTVAVALGGEYVWNDQVRLRGGYFYNPTPIPEENFDTTVPGSDSHGVNVGFGYDIQEDMTLDFAWTGLLYEDRDITNNVGAALGGNVDGKYENFTNVVTTTVSYQF